MINHKNTYYISKIRGFTLPVQTRLIRPINERLVNTLRGTGRSNYRNAYIFHTRAFLFLFSHTSKHPKKKHPSPPNTRLSTAKKTPREH